MVFYAVNSLIFFQGKSSRKHEWLYILIGYSRIVLLSGDGDLNQRANRWKKNIRYSCNYTGRRTGIHQSIYYPVGVSDWQISLFGFLVHIANGALPWYTSVLAFSGVACVIMSDKSQRIGDIVAGTIVIFTRSKTSWQDTVFTEVEADYKPRYPEVMQMSDKDLNSLKMIIETVKKNNNHELAFRISERIKWKLNIQGDQDAKDFLETLLKDYNYYSNH